MLQFWCVNLYFIEDTFSSASLSMKIMTRGSNFFSPFQYITVETWAVHNSVLIFSIKVYVMLL